MQRKLTITLILLFFISLGIIVYSKMDVSSVHNNIQEFKWDKFLSRNRELNFQIVNNKYKNGSDLITYEYDYNHIQEIEGRLKNVNRKDVLRSLFSQAQKKADSNKEEDIWFEIISLVENSMRHSPITQPMYSDRTMVTDPLVLLELGEGRCGHIARLVVDLALANNYEARLVQLAAHLVAEVKWENMWHCIDADIDFPVASYKKIYPHLPSVEELSQEPYTLDSLPARGWVTGLNYQRTMDSQLVNDYIFYPARIKTSAVYFGKEILEQTFYGKPSTIRKNIEYIYKNRDFNDWQNDKYFGWNNLKIETKKAATVPTEFMLARPQLIAPTIIYKKKNDHEVNIPIKFIPAYMPKIKSNNCWDVVKDYSNISYEIKISSQSRGWDYDFRDYKYFGNYGVGDIFSESIAQTNNDLIAINIKITHIGSIYIEIIPKYENGKNTYYWPSNEVKVDIVNLVHRDNPLSI